MSSFADSPRSALEVAADATTDENDKENKTVDVMAAVHKLFARMERQIEISKPANTIHYIVDMLCRYYPEHLHGFASIWSMDPDVQREKIDVVNFFRVNKMSAQIAAHFINAGYDTVETLESLTPGDLQDIEAFNDAKWLPGHKVRLVQLFSDIQDRVRQYKSDCTALIAPYMPRPPPTVASVALPTPRVISTPAAPSSGLATSTQLLSSSFYGGCSSALHPPQTARYISATAGPPSYVMSPGQATRTTRVVTSSNFLPYSARGSRMSTVVSSSTGAWANTSRDISTTIIRSGPGTPVRSLLLRQDEWTSGVMFDGDTGRIIASTAPLPGEADTSATTSLGSTPSEAPSNSTPLDYSRLAANVKGMIKAYSPADKGQAALSDGVDWLGIHFDVHAFYPPLLYGRQSLSEEGDDISPEMESTVGVAACNGLRNDVPIILVITYSSSSSEDGTLKKSGRESRSTRRRAKDEVENWMAFDEKEEDAKGSSIRRNHTQSENDGIPANSAVEDRRRSVPSRTREDAYAYQVKGEEALEGRPGLEPRSHSESPTTADGEVVVKVSDLVWIRGLLDAQRAALEASRATNTILADGIRAVLAPYMKGDRRNMPVDSGTPDSPVSACKLVRALRKHMTNSNLKSLKEAEHHKSAAARKKFLVFSFTCLQLLLVIIILVIAVSTSRMQATYITPILLIITLLSHPECTATGPDRKQRKSQFLPLSEADLPSGTYRAITGSNDRICDTLPDLTRFDMIVEGSSEGQTAQLNASCCGSPVSMDTGHPLGRYEQARELFRIGPKLFLQQECFRFVKSQIESGLDEFQIRFAALFGLRRSSNPLSDLVMCKDGLEDEITVCYKPTRGGYKLSLTACTHHFTLAKDTSTPEGFEAPSSVEASEETKQRRKRKTNNPTTTEPKQQKMIIVDSEYAAAVPSSGAITDGSYVVEEADFTAQVIIVTDADRKQRHGAFQIFGEKDILVPALEWVKDGRGCLQSWPLSLEEPLPILKKRFGRVAFSVSPDSIVICPKDVNKLELTLSDEDAGLNHSFILTKQPQ
ncbi:hypothetical protein FOL46_002571 [Perkinsus olseni]|uniref:Uncharacterized protein n=1 Tax=Perkinsus olseni TaxID=32597 RepID=A0A7J6M788_PEROL|nr:hypothetical protein FOL46_002571 [Perkinsus olseni]